MVKTVSGSTCDCRNVPYQYGFPEAPRPMGLVGDPLRLGQVLLNLAGKAVKFTEQGQVIIQVRRAAANGASRSGCQQSKADTATVLRFSVIDTCPGLKPDRAQTFFQSFTHTVTVAENGRQALDAIAARTAADGGSFDAVLMDVQMTAMDGYISRCNRL